MMTEQQIKAALDGKFVRFGKDGAIVSQAVPPGFIPVYAVEVVKPMEYRNGKPGKPWTAEEDQFLLDQRNRGTRIDVIARRLHRTEKALTRRWQQFVEDGRAQPKPHLRSAWRHWPADFIQEIDAMRFSRIPHAKIADKLGITLKQLKSYTAHVNSRGRYGNGAA